MLYTYYLHILHNLQAVKIIFLKVFLTCTFKDPKWAEKLANLAGKKLNFAEFIEFSLGIGNGSRLNIL